MTKAGNSRVLRAIPLLIVVCLLSSQVYAPYGGRTGGSGTPNNPYLIYTAEEINEIGLHQEDWDKHFKLMADIDLSSYTGTAFNIIGIDQMRSFTGVFDGNGHTISNLSYTLTSYRTQNIGLFGYVEGPNAEIKNLGMINPNRDTRARDNIGSLAGYNSGKITNCYVQGGSFMGNERVGGLVGVNAGTITNCYSTSSVVGGDQVGGLVGLNSGSIADCNSSGDVSGHWWIGGLVGYNTGTITNCYSTGTVSNTGYYIGGLVASNGGTITNSYSKSIIEGGSHVGGLAGSNDRTIMNCYSTSSVEGGDHVGGLVGFNFSSITKCYSSGDVSGAAVVGGLVGENYGNNIMDSFWDTQTSGQTTSVGGMGKTTAEMHDPNTFISAGWDFANKPNKPFAVWIELAGGGYPILWWQISPQPELPAFSGGTGEPDNPYLVSTAVELNSIGHNPKLMNAHFKLLNDIDLIGVDYFIVGNEAFPFMGVFNGNGHTISNFSYTYMPKGISEPAGFFGYVDGPNAEIRDLGLIDPNVSGWYYVGSLAGFLEEGTIKNCYIVGGSVSGDMSVGGLVGYNYPGSTITNCYTSSSVFGSTSVGGLVGYTNAGTIKNCYSTSRVSGGSSVGGLVGSGGYVQNSFWDVQTSGQNTSAGGKGRTTAQMQMASTFFGWDENGNEGIWTIDEGNDYPRLWWENKPGEVLETQHLSALLTGAGTQDNPYLIYTAEELFSIFPSELDKDFKLMADIDLSHYVGTELDIIGITSPFTGVFDGNGKKITNLNNTNGLFMYVSGSIKDLGLIDSHIDRERGSSVGSLVDNLQGGTITNCYATGSVMGTGSYVSAGGLVGENRGTIINCYVIGSITGNGWNVGGLVGENLGTISNCHAKGSVTGKDRVGGLIGDNNTGTITNCYSSASVSGRHYVGGLVGGSNGNISTSYSTGMVSGTYDYIGGLVGDIWSGSITECYSTGTVIGNRNVGGLVGNNHFGKVIDCFWDTQTSGQSISACGTGKTTAEMQTASTFLEVGWDFIDETANGTEDIWRIREGRDYPRLWWESIPEVVARTIYVDDDANGENNGSSWTDAYCLLQDALAAAYGGDEIRVAQGTYKPDQIETIITVEGFQVISSGDRTETFRLINGVSLKGGYAGFGEVNPDERDIETYKSILSGDLNSDDLPNFTNNSENSYHVVRSDGTDSTAVLDGFTIIAGNADGIRQPETGSGGGMYNVGGSPTITFCTFSVNFADWGGAINNKESCNAQITNCTFIGNSANFGGAINNNERSNPQIINCILIGNIAEEGGAMMNITESNAIVTNCTFTGNRASNNGGGISCADTSSTAINTILWGNSPNEIRLWNSSITVIHCNVQGGWHGIGNINADPLFTDAVNGDCHLKSQAGRWDSASKSWITDDVTSPCIDAGDPMSPIGLELEPNGSRINIGAYGGTSEASKSP
jgi:predicted outer membrane repeat protein